MVSASPPHVQALPGEIAGFPEPPVREIDLNSRQNWSKAPFIVSCVFSASALIGILFALWLRKIPAGNPDPRFFFNVFYVLFARNEVMGLAVVALFGLIAALLFFRGRTVGMNLVEVSPSHARWFCIGAAIMVFAVTVFGTQVVFHDYGVTADENLADFQARIFLRGKIQAEVPAHWVDAVHVLQPTFVNYFPATHSWMSAYLPVYAAMRAVFQSVDLQAALNPFLAAVTIFALYGLARRIWPDSTKNALLAIGLLATSSQFLLMSMTGYAMPAHLAFNTVWLWLYTHPDRRLFYLAPVIGGLAIGLHQPIVHALFVMPFLSRFVWQRRWRDVVVYGSIYLLACAGWYAWKMHFMPPAGPEGRLQMFRLANPRMAIIQPMNLLLIIGWASLATPLLAVFGFRSAFKARPIVQDAIMSCVLTFGFYYFFYLDQQHGWGYRYFHGTLACLIIVALTGFERLCARIGELNVQRFVLAGLMTSIMIQLPLRCVQAERFVRPFARSAAVIQAMPTAVVALDPRDAWYSADLIRNDPFLEQRPLVVSEFRLDPKAIAVLSKAGSVHFFDKEQFTRLDMVTNCSNQFWSDPFRLGRGK